MARTNLPAHQVLESSSEKLARLITATGVDVRFTDKVKGPCADIDAGVIMLPNLPEKMDDKEFRRLQGAIDHEAAHILYTKTLDGRKPRRSNGLKGLIENAFEDGRINRLMGDRYIGSIDNIQDLNKTTSEIIDAKIASGELDLDAPQVAALAAMLRASYQYVWKRPDMAALLKGGEDLTAKLPADLADQMESVETYEDVQALIEPVAEWIDQANREEPESGDAGEDESDGEGESSEESDGSESSESDADGDSSGSDGSGGSDGSEDDSDGSESDSDDESEGDDEGDDDSDGSGGDSSDSEDSDESDGGEGDSGDSDGTADGDDSSDADSDMELSKEHQDSDSDEGETDKMQPVRAEEQKAMSDEEFENKVINLAEDIAEALEATLPTAEKNAEADPRGYHVDPRGDRECHIREIKKELITTRHAEMYLKRQSDTIFANYRAKVGPLRARLVMDLQSTGKVWQRDLSRGRALDTGRLVRPKFADNRVFKNKNRKDSVDTAVSLLVDCSGSMGGGPIEAALQLAALFGEALEMANVPCEIVGFTTRGSSGGKSYGVRHNRTLHITFKDFNESVRETRDDWPAITTCMANNVDGEAVMWAAKRLAKRKEERKVLMVLSDGYPAAVMRAASMDYLNSHLKDVVKTVESAGIETLGIGIMTDAPKKFYDKSVQYNNLDDLMTGVYATISTLLRTGKLVARVA